MHGELVHMGPIRIDPTFLLWCVLLCNLLQASHARRMHAQWHPPRPTPPEPTGQSRLGTTSTAGVFAVSMVRKIPIVLAVVNACQVDGQDSLQSHDTTLPQGSICVAVLPRHIRCCGANGRDIATGMNPTWPSPESEEYNADMRTSWRQQCFSAWLRSVRCTSTPLSDRGRPQQARSWIFPSGQCH